MNLFKRLFYKNKENGFEYVDLGLSVMWATCNVGADKPEDSGKYFQWGRVRGYDFKNEDDFIQSDIPVPESKTSYTYSNKTLSLEDDAARVNMGGKWRMPTFSEIFELKINTQQEFIKNVGLKLTSKINGNSILFPFTGYAIKGISDTIQIYDFLECGSVFSSQLSSSSLECAIAFSFDSNNVGKLIEQVRRVGIPVRGVFEK